MSFGLISDGKPTQGRRAIHASIIVIACIMVLAGGEGFVSSVQGGKATEGTTGGLEVSLRTVLSQGLEASWLSELPAGFEDEIFDTKDYAEVYVSPSGGTIGFSLPEDEADAFMVLSETLGSKGWTKVESGLDSAASFIKQGGIHTWMYLSCVSIGDSTSVVVQLV